MAIELDLAEATALLNECKKITTSLDLTSTRIDTGRADRELAEMGRQLLRGAALARAAGVELEMAYWEFRGVKDPRGQAV